MGQYYKAVNISHKEWVNSWDYDSGMKLMEHSWIRNPFCNAVESLLIPGGKWYKSAIVWAGDYADEEIHLLQQEIDVYSKWYKKEHKTLTLPREHLPNVYQMCKNADYEDVPEWSFKKLIISPVKYEEVKVYRFIVNHTKEEYVNKNTVPSIKGWRVHPLPLLTCSGNGRGGGDYYPNNDLDEMFVGNWAGDVISLEKNIPKGYMKIIPNFYENF